MANARECVVHNISEKARYGTQKTKKAVGAAGLRRDAESCARSHESAHAGLRLFDPEYRVDVLGDVRGFPEETTDGTFERRETETAPRALMSQDPLDGDVADATAAVVKENWPCLGDGASVYEIALDFHDPNLGRAQVGAREGPLAAVLPRIKLWWTQGRLRTALSTIETYDPPKRLT